MIARPKILLVDDRDENLLALEALLREEPCETVRARSGPEALEKLLAHEFAAALIDVQMPEMDGFELAELMRGPERTRSIPIIFVTAGIHDEERVFRGYESGAVDFLHKPVSERVLRAKVRVFLELHRQRQELAARVQELETVLAAVPAAVFVSRDPRMQYIEPNRFAQELLGVPPGANVSASAPGATTVRFEAPDGTHLAPDELPVQRAARSGAEIGSVQLRVVRPDGQLRWMLGSARPLRDERGHTIGAVGAFLDVTEARRAEEAARRQAELIQLSRDAIFVWKLEGGIESWNGGAEALYGHTAAEALGRVPPELLGTEAEGGVGAILERLRREGRWEGELRHRRKDGSGLIVSCRMQLSRGSDGVLRVLETNRDVTENRKAQDALREAERQYRELMEAIPQLVWTCDLEGRCDYVSRQWADYTGIPVERLLGDGWRGPIHPDDLGAAVEGWRRAASLGAPFQTRFRLRGADGTYRWFRTQGAALRTADGRIRRWFGANTDIDDEVRAEEVLREADHRKNEFLAVLSHELRNPLAPIRNGVYVLERAVPGSAQARRALEVVERQVNQLTRLVDDLLDVTRITRNKVQIKKQRLDLNELVRRTLEDHRAQFERAKVALVADLADREVPVDADWDRLAQVVGNLLQNAAKFTPQGGTTRVTLRADRDRHCARLSVRDDGVGMDAAMISRLFKPFMQADSTLDRSKGGLGLGLSLVKGMVNLHGGEVTAYSAGQGKGSEFVVTLPLSAAASEPALAPRAPAGPGGRRVLIVEDNADAASSLKEVLELLGHLVSVAHTGPEGVEKAREELPEVVLCDIGLPGMDGYAVARAIRDDPRLARVRLVALSGYALPEDIERSSAAGFERHLAKPPRIELIEQVLREHPGEARPEAP